ncbi:MAG: hypothetical protein Unbinned3528contig1000_29 [Prokaryotic dsDNA virus sp.]|nr:MAG: hypothetical protein Unbinned3528contig1000_29 [Prokaryotic dsDNA virus sp.]|tara:strand:- start:31220 stop:31807 length:588 start_codon:yes stop_codon:yes gene_type:complete
MKSQELISQIKNLLGMEETIKLAQLKLENGTILEADSFEQNMEVFILSDDERISLPIGEYQLEDGRKLKVEDEGVISEIGMNEDYEDKDKEEKEDKEEEKEEMEYVTKEEFKKEMDDLRKYMEDMMKNKEEDEEKEKEEMASQVATEIAVEMSKQPATKPIKHSPENKEDKKKFVFADNRTQTTLDRIMSKIANK